MRRRVKKGRVKRKPRRKISAKKAEEIPKLTESLEHLMHQKEEIRALLSSLEDAYSEATIMEEDYREIKSKNLTRLEEINKKIETLKREGVKPKPPPRPEIPVVEPPTAVPVEAPPIPAAPPVVVEEKVERKPKKKKGLVSPEDLKKLEVDLAERVKEMVEDIGAKVSEKDVLEIKNKFTRFDTEIEKMKALIETVREGKKVSDEKIQRVVEGLAEIRTMVYGREASMKEWEVKLEKVMDIMNRVEPEKIMMEMGRRDKEVENQNLRINKLEEMTKEFGEMVKNIEKVLRDIGSLENVVKVSSDASEKLMNMQNIERNNQKMLDKIQGLYAELSKRMEEFMLYRAKQDRMEDLINEMLKNLDDINTKAAYFVTRDDLESFRASMQAAAPSAPSPKDELSDLKSEKEEIEMLMKSLEEEFKGVAISKEEYEKMKNANLAKLKEIEGKIKEAEKGKVLGAIKEGKPEGKPKKIERGIPPEEKGKEEMLLKDLEETFKKGFISKEAYEKTKKMILRKG